MTTELEAQPGSEELLRAYTPTERLAAQNILNCATNALKSPVPLEAILNEIDQAVCTYNPNNPLQQRALLQLQTLDAIFHLLSPKELDPVPITLRMRLSPRNFLKISTSSWKNPHSPSQNQKRSIKRPHIISLTFVIPATCQA